MNVAEELGRVDKISETLVRAMGRVDAVASILETMNAKEALMTNYDGAVRTADNGIEYVIVMKDGRAYVRDERGVVAEFVPAEDAEPIDLFKMASYALEDAILHGWIPEDENYQDLDGAAMFERARFLVDDTEWPQADDSDWPETVDDSERKLIVFELPLWMVPGEYDTPAERKRFLVDCVLDDLDGGRAKGAYLDRAHSYIQDVREVAPSGKWTSYVRTGGTWTSYPQWNQ